jgi:hypothetical protein
MGRIIDFNSSGKTIAASTTVSFTSSDIPSSGIVKYHIAMTGAGNTFNAIDRIRVKANGIPFIDITSSLYRAFIARFTAGRILYPPAQVIGVAAGAPTDWRRFTIPLCFIDREKSEEADVCQFPVGAQATIEIAFNANAVAGSAFLAWTETDITPLCWPKLYSLPMNIAASSTSSRLALADDAVIRGFGLETSGLGRFRAVLNGRQVYHAQGQPVTSATVTEDMLFLETDMLEGGITYQLQAGTAAVQNAIGIAAGAACDPYWIKNTSGDNATPGRSFVEIGTLAAWSGVASELGIYGVVPYEQGSGV